MAAGGTVMVAMAVSIAPSAIGCFVGKRHGYLMTASVHLLLPAQAHKGHSVKHARTQARL